VEERKIICDTDVLIDYFEVDKPRHSQTREVIDKEIGLDNVIISIITKMELMAGAFNKAELRSISKNINRLDLLLIKPEVSRIASELIEEYTLSHNLCIPDAIIAATSIYTDLKLFTYNNKDYKFIKGLKLFSL
jgi:predicted nucleic acid-binding protein